MRKIKRDIVSAVIISRDDKILLGQKDPAGGGVFLDCWHIPGGGVEENEEKIQALKREIKEEAGIDISEEHIELISDSDSALAEKTLKSTGERVLVEMYFCTYKVEINKTSEKIEIKPGDDLVILKWVKKNDLASLKLTPPSTKLFKKMGWL